MFDTGRLLLALAQLAIAVLIGFEVVLLVRLLAWNTPGYPKAEPPARGRVSGVRGRWPWAFPLVLATLFGVSAAILARSGALAPGLSGAGMPWEQVTDLTPPEESARAGERAYLNRCAPCHLPDGRGLPPAYPPLRESPVVNGPVDGHVRVTLFGSDGLPAHHAGAARMPAFHAVASDAELAAILTYERSAWGHEAGPVRPSDVGRGRAEPPGPPAQVGGR